MADKRRVAAWLLVAGVTILVLAASMGPAFPFSVFIVALGLAAAFHWGYACRRCTNAHCALNARGACFVVGKAVHDPTQAPCAARSRGRGTVPVDSRVAALPLLGVLAVGIVLAWRAVPEATVPSLAFLAVGSVIYSSATCRHCTNTCPLRRVIEQEDAGR